MSVPADLITVINRGKPNEIANALISSGINISSIKKELEEEGLYNDVMSSLNRQQQQLQQQQSSNGQSTSIQLSLTSAQPRRLAGNRSGGKKTKRSKKQKKGKRTRRNK